MRIILCFAAILFAAVLMAGCKKDISVVPATVHQTIKVASIDSTSLDGGKNDPLHPPH